jgi:hypothetical protein
MPFYFCFCIPGFYILHFRLLDPHTLYQTLPTNHIPLLTLFVLGCFTFHHMIEVLI